LRITSTSGTPTAACFYTPTICSTEKCFFSSAISAAFPGGVLGEN
jgi:hypothetical protein